LKERKYNRRNTPLELVSIEKNIMKVLSSPVTFASLFYTQIAVYMLKKVIVLAVITCPFYLLAQPGPAGGELPPCEEIGLPGPGFNEPCIPIDGGLSLLIAAGLAYGGKRALDSRRKV